LYAMKYASRVAVTPVSTFSPTSIMTHSTAKTEETTVTFAEDELLKLQLRVARRADELSQQTGREQQKDLERWLEAEREVLRPASGIAS